MLNIQIWWRILVCQFANGIHDLGQIWSIELSSHRMPQFTRRSVLLLATLQQLATESCTNGRCTCNKQSLCRFRWFSAAAAAVCWLQLQFQLALWVFAARLEKFETVRNRWHLDARVLTETKTKTHPPYGVANPQKECLIETHRETLSCRLSMAAVEHVESGMFGHIFAHIHNYNASKNIQTFKARNITFALRVCSILTIHLKLNIFW